MPAGSAVAKFDHDVHILGRGGEESPTAPTTGSAPIGLPYLYSHNNMPKGHPLRAASCGQAAIATLLDYWNVNPYGLPRSVTKLPTGAPIPDQRSHFPSELTAKVLDDFPPTDLFGIRFIVRETLRDPLQHHGFQTDESHSGVGGDGSEERAARIQWIQQHPRIPVICLVSMTDIDPKGYEGVGWYESLHWGVVHAISATHVWMASWHQDC